MNARSLALPIALAGFALAGPAAGQTLLQRWDGAPGERFGHAVAFIEDVTGDGIADCLVGAPAHLTGAGSVRLFSGATGAEVYEVQHADVRHFGFAVDAVGDLDGDGWSDFVAGAPWNSMVFVHSGRDGALLRTILPPNTQSAYMGFSVCGGADLDSDGSPDFAVGSPNGLIGSVYLFSGVDGSLIRTLTGPAGFGSALDFIDDVEGDGVVDLLVGAPTAGQLNGEVRVHSGATGALLRTHSASAFAFHLGRSVADVGDVDGDGTRDYGACGPCDEPCCCKWSGECFVYSGASGIRIREYQRGLAPFGAGLSAAGDADGDGQEDVLVSVIAYPGVSSEEDVAALALDGGRAGMEVLLVHSMLPTTSFDGFYRAAIAGGVDIDGDGVTEFLLGSHQQGVDNAGRVDLVTFATCPPGGSRPVCETAPNSVGEGARIAALGAPSIGTNDFRLRADLCPPSQPGVFILGSTGTELPFFDGFQCVAPPIVRLPVMNTGTGTLVLPFDLQQPIVPPAAVQSGDTRFFQLVYRDPAAGGTGTNATHAVQVTFCP